MNKKAMEMGVLITIIITVLTIIIILIITGQLPFSEALDRILSRG